MMPLLGRIAFLLYAAVLTGGFSGVARAALAQPIICLFSDYSWDDPYGAQLKGAIVSIAPRVQILDLIHSAAPFNVVEGAYLLDQSAEAFPAGAIFVAVVDPQVGTEHDPILLETAKGKFYLGYDNGLFTSVINREGFTGAWKLDRPEFFRDGDGSPTFRGRDIFGPVAAHLALGTDPDKMGTPLKSISMLPARDSILSGETISAEVQHIDRLGNMILNIHENGDVSGKLKEGNLVKIQVGRESFSGPLVKSNTDVGKGRLLLLFNSGGLLEVSVNQGSAAKMLKVEPGTVIFLKP
jgi:S-adenosylmethionine hydrolase